MTPTVASSRFLHTRGRVDPTSSCNTRTPPRHDTPKKVQVKQKKTAIVILLLVLLSHLTDKIRNCKCEIEKKR